MNRRGFLLTGATAGLAVAAPSLLRADDVIASVRGPAIHTVLGPVPPEKLGVTLMHEHAPTVDWSELYETAPAPVDELRAQMLATAERQLRPLSAATVDVGAAAGIVECTPIRVGRYPDLLVETARQSGVHLIACTGFWCEAMAPQHPWAVRMSVADDGARQIAALYIREINEGMEDPAGAWGERFTDVKVGIIKVATSTWLRPSERRCHEAAVIASRETGCPITTHTTDGGGLEQAELMLSLGAAPDKVIVGHQGFKDDRQNDAAELSHLRLADLGCYVQFDRVGSPRYPVEAIAQQVQRLVAAGHAERVLLGHDHVPYVYTKYAQNEKPADGWQENDSDFTIVPVKLAGALADLGVSAETVRTMLVENPRRVLAF